ncbi:MAG: zinc-binding dehydrogenase [Thermaceae bacterium]|nr:zinc-binding dehydrogenase [Thermaceae bacterium]
MGQQLIFSAPKQVGLEEYPDPPLQPTEVRVVTHFSGISAGTELTQYRGTNPYLQKHFDPEQRLFVDQPGLTYPLRGFGYQQVGRIVEVGSKLREVQVGQMVWGSWGHRTHAILDWSLVSPKRLPQGANPLWGIFPRIGAIALNPVHEANIHVGETVAIFGLGVIGLIAIQLACLNGAAVIAVDRLDKRLELARRLGADHVINFHNDDPAKTIKTLTRRGVDVSLELSGSYTALHEAIRATAYNSKVVAAGFYQGEGLNLSLGEEFHHNRIQLISSQIQGINPTLSHRWDRLRLEQTVMALAIKGKIELLSLISHTFPAGEAAKAFELIDQHSGETLQVVLDFREMS